MNAGVVLTAGFMALIFVLLTAVLYVPGLLLWYTGSAIVECTVRRGATRYDPAPDLPAAPLLLALAGAAVLTGLGFFGASREVFRDPWPSGARVEFRTRSAWREIAEPAPCSDCYIHVSVSHVASDGRRAVTEISEYNPEWDPQRAASSGRGVRWAPDG